MTDPTGARTRMIKPLWDAPRYPVRELPAVPAEPAAKPARAFTRGQRTLRALATANVRDGRGQPDFRLS